MAALLIVGAMLERTGAARVAGLRRSGKPVAADADKALTAADGLFVVGRWTAIDRLQTATRELIVPDLPAEHAHASGVLPYPFALAVLIAASAAYPTSV